MARSGNGARPQFRQRCQRRPIRRKAAHARARSQVQQIIGAADGFFVVLDHENGIAQVTQSFEGLEEAFVVALVQADAWLVKYIKDADEARADLGGEPDALGFAAAERAAFAVQGEVTQAHVFEGNQVRARISLMRSAAILRWKSVNCKSTKKASVSSMEKRANVHDRKARNGRRRPTGRGVAKGDGENFRLETAAPAGVAGLRVHEGFQAVSGEFAFRLDVEPLQIGDDSFKRFFFALLIFPRRAQKLKEISSSPAPKSSFCLKSWGKSFQGVSTLWLKCAAMPRRSAL